MRYSKKCEICETVFESDFPRSKYCCAECLRLSRVESAKNRRRARGVKECTNHLPIVERLQLKIKKGSSGCWLWQGCVTSKGYGVTSIKDKYIQTHRAMWIGLHGEPPEGMFVCHSCDVPNCINPEHLFLGTPNDNMQDMIRKGRAVAFWKGKKMPLEMRQKQSLAKLGKKQKPEHIAKRVAAYVGSVRSEETRNKISQSNKGKLKSEQHRQALKDAWVRRKENAKNR